MASNEQPPAFWDFAPKTSVFIAGSGRSGTTWLAELLSLNGNHRILFEPFAGWMVPEFRHFDRYVYLAPDEKSPWFERPADKILSGRIRDPWIDQLHTGKKVYFRRLVKDVYSNIRLGWLQSIYPHLRIVLIIRHPCAVAASQLRHQWKIDPDRFLRNPAMVEKYFSDEERMILAGSLDPFEKIIVTWCVENRIPRLELGEKLHVVFYEDLYLNPITTMQDLADFTGINLLADKQITSKGHSKLSALAGGKLSTAQSGKNPVEEWLTEISSTQQQRAQELMEIFKITDLYSARCPSPLDR